MRNLKLKPYEPTEAQVLKSILTWLRRDSRVAWANRFNTGAHVVGEGRHRRFIRYAFPGCSDILGQLVTGQFLAIEVKRPSTRGKARPEQLAFLETVNRHGGLGLVAAGIDEVASGIDAFMANQTACDRHRCEKRAGMVRGGGKHEKTPEIESESV